MHPFGFEITPAGNRTDLFEPLGPADAPLEWIGTGQAIRKHGLSPAVLLRAAALGMARIGLDGRSIAFLAADVVALAERRQAMKRAGLKSDPATAKRRDPSILD